MKIFQVLMLCLWLRNTSTEPLFPTCACTHTPTMFRSSSMQPVDIIWPGKCFQMAAPVLSGSRLIRLLKEGKEIFVLKQHLEIGSCFGLHYAINDVTGVSCPRIISRKEWGAKKPKRTKYLSTPVKYAVVHHSDTPQCLSENACKERIRSIQSYHMHHNHWDDIGYNYLIGGDGNVYEGRGANTVGAHVRNYNTVSLGICVIGNYEVKTPTAKTVNALKSILSCLMTRQKLRSNYLLRGHRDLGKTTCPGKYLYNIINKWPHYRE